MELFRGFITVPDLFNAIGSAPNKKWAATADREESGQTYRDNMASIMKLIKNEDYNE